MPLQPNVLLGAARFKRLMLERRKAGATFKFAAPETSIIKGGSYGAAQVLGDRQLRFTISTGAVDRGFDTVNQAGWNLSGFKANPVVLWQHGSWDFPIGKCVDIGLEGASLRATVQFVPADMPFGVGELAETVFRMCAEGFLSATSVGFLPLDFEVTTDPARGADDWLPGFDFKSQDLMEFSIVTIPANPEAVIDDAHRESVAGVLDDIRDRVAASAPGPAVRAKLFRKHDDLDRRFLA